MLQMWKKHRKVCKATKKVKPLKVIVCIYQFLWHVSLLDNVEALKKLLSKLKGLDLTDKIQGKIFRKASGGYADVYIGRLVDESKPIAIKQFRIYEQQSNPGKFIKVTTSHLFSDGLCINFMLIVTQSMVKELRVWSKVQHTNILPLKGYKLEVIHGTHWPSLSFITEWMEAGSMMKYIREKHNLDNVHLVIMCDSNTDTYSYFWYQRLEALQMACAICTQTT